MLVIHSERNLKHFFPFLLWFPKLPAKDNQFSVDHRFIVIELEICFEAGFSDSSREIPQFCPVHDVPIVCTLHYFAGSELNVNRT